MNSGISNRFSWLLTGIFLGGSALITGISFYLYNGSAVLFLSLFACYFLHGLLFSLLMMFFSYRGLKSYFRSVAAPEQPLPTVAVAIPIFNEEQVVVECIHSILKQTLKPAEIILINDGSTDDTLKVLKRAFQLEAQPINVVGEVACAQTLGFYRSKNQPNIYVIDKQRGGKADALNAALKMAQSSIFITVDADSFLHPHAMENLTRAMARDEQIVAAGGTVKAGNGINNELLVSDVGQLPQGVLPIVQWIEYATGFVWRFGWSFINTLLLLSGSFSAFRSEILRACGGFDKDSITEDYEMAYRLHAYHLSRGLAYKMVTVPDALVYTLVPETFSSLIKQRIRWFQGFIETLFRYRSLILNSRYRTLGIFMLPIKAVDALAPLWSLLVYFFLLIHLLYRPFPIPLSLFFGLIVLRWVFDIVISCVLLTLHYRFIAPRLSIKKLLGLYSFAPFYLILNQALWLLYSLTAYYRALTRVKRWDKVVHRGFRVLYPAQTEEESMSGD